MQGTVKYQSIVSPYAYPGLCKLREEITLNELLNLVCDYFKITPVEICDKARNSLLVEARSYFYFTARNHTDSTLKEIGAIINKDHSSVIHLLQKFQSELSIYSETKEQYRKFLETINYKWAIAI